MLRIIAFQRGHCMWQHDQHRNNIIKFPWIRDILTVLVQYNTVDSHSLPRTEDAHQMHDTTVVGYVFLLNSSTWNHESLFVHTVKNDNRGCMTTIDSHYFGNRILRWLPKKYGIQENSTRGWKQSNFDGRSLEDTEVVGPSLDVWILK